MTEQPLTPPIEPDLDLPPERPTWPLVIGWISVSWSVIFGFCCMGWGIVGLAVFLPMGVENMKKADPSMDVSLPPQMQLGPAMIAMLGTGVLLSLVLLVAGALTISRKPAGRTAHIIYAVLSIISVIASSIYQFMQIPALRQFRADHPGNPFVKPSPMGEGFDYFGPVIGLVIGMVFPAFILIWFLVSKRGKGPMDVDTPDIV
jgi:hypothetical protein